MGLYAIDCPQCNKSYMWFSGNVDQRCESCQNFAPPAADFQNLPMAEPIVLSNEDFDQIVKLINDPPPPSQNLIRARQRYLDLKKEDIRDQMDEHMVKTSSPKRL
jgi:hypothetical protein